MMLIDNETVQRNIARHRTMAMIGAHEETEERMKGYNPSSFLAGFDYGMELACKLIANAPTVEAVPVVRGEWIVAYEGIETNLNTWKATAKYKYICNLCGYSTGNQGKYFKYCPNCGAKMHAEKSKIYEHLVKIAEFEGLTDEEKENYFFGKKVEE